MGTGRKSGEKHYLDRLLNCESGHVLLTTLISIPLVMAILLAGVEVWGITTIYQKTESLKYKTLSKMQITGGLLAEDKAILIDELVGIGADEDTIKLQGNIDGSATFWPDSVDLQMEFEPMYFNSFMARVLIGGALQEPLKIGVKGQAISEKANPYIENPGEDDGENSNGGNETGGGGHGHGHGNGNGGHGNGNGSGNSNEDGSDDSGESDSDDKDDCYDD